MEKMQLTRQQIIALAKNQDNPDLRYEKAFLLHLFGSANNVDIFEILLGWLPYAKREDGSIYKSDAELAKESGLSAGTVERSRKIIREAGFDIYVKKANGAPTNHYRFDLEKFIRFVAGKLKAEVEKVREWLHSSIRSKAAKSGAGKQQSDRIDSRNIEETMAAESGAEIPESAAIASTNMQPSLTESPTSSTNNWDDRNTKTIQGAETLQPPEQVVVGFTAVKGEIFALFGETSISNEQLKRWILLYGVQRVRDVIAHAKDVKNPGGWIRKALEHHYQWGKPEPKRKKYTEYGAEEVNPNRKKYTDYICTG